MKGHILTKTTAVSRVGETGQVYKLWQGKRETRSRAQVPKAGKRDMCMQ